MKTRQHLARLALAAGAVCAIGAPAFAQQPAATLTEATTATAAPEKREAGQRGKHAHERRGHHGPRAGMHHGGFGFGERGMLRGIELTEAQRDQIFSIRHAAMPQARDAMKEVGAAKRELGALTRADSFDEAKAQAAAEREGAALAKLSLLRAQTSSQVYATLTPEQKTTLQERREQARERWEQRREQRAERPARAPQPAPAQ